MTVDHVLKGSAPREIAFLDFGGRLAASVASARYPTFSFGAGGCSVFDTDPTGTYAVLGLFRRGDGSYLANRLLTFFLGDAPAGPEYDRALARPASLGPVRLPAAGTGGRQAEGPGGTQAQAAPRITIAPPTGSSNTVISVVGAGFAPGDTVYIEAFPRREPPFQGGTIRLATVAAGPDGRFETTVRFGGPPTPPEEAPTAFNIMAYASGFGDRTFETVQAAPKAVFILAGLNHLPATGSRHTADSARGAVSSVLMMLGVSLSLVSVWLVLRRR